MYNKRLFQVLEIKNRRGTLSLLSVDDSLLAYFSVSGKIEAPIFCFFKSKGLVLEKKTR